MNTIRKTSLVFGLFFAGTFIFSIPALFFYDPLFNDSNYLLPGGFDTRISMGALFEILTAICNIATAVIIFPLFRRVNETVSLGYVASRTVESLLILTGVISLMSVMTFRAEFIPGGDTHDITMIRQMFVVFHDWTFLLGPQFCSGFGNGMLLGYLMYRSGAVPRRMALFGLIGGPLAFIGGIMVLFDILEPLSPGLFALTALEIIWELFITFYALIKGFRPLVIQN
jgi:hypothetical protein